MLSRKAGLGARGRVLRAGLTLAVAAGLAGIALADPDNRFAFLLIPALAIAAIGLIAGLFYARAAVVGVAILIASAPSAFWYLSSSLRIEQLGGGLTSATRDVVPGLIAVGCMVVAAGLAIVFGVEPPGLSGRCLRARGCLSGPKCRWVQKTRGTIRGTPVAGVAATVDERTATVVS